MRTSLNRLIPLGKPAPGFRSITIMLTEFCNLDCWMCDFAHSKGLREANQWSSEEYVAFLEHPFFSNLSSIGFTGGEPFAYAGIKELYGKLQQHFPDAFINFSSNATLLKPMIDTFSLTRDWNRTYLYTSIDGVDTHDLQRGKKGAFIKSMNNLSAMRERFPELGIDVKFTITPVNYKELYRAYKYVSGCGFNFTAKMVENNPYYTNVISSDSHTTDFQFKKHEIELIAKQLHDILSDAGQVISDSRRQEMKELLSSLDPDWCRKGRCTAPTQSVFLDARMNLFCCKEYPPVLNLNESSLDEITSSSAYFDAIAAERKNQSPCLRCTSQLKTNSGISSLFRRVL